MANGTPGTPTATGDLTATDVDNRADAFQAVARRRGQRNGYGSYTLTAAGVWTYTLDNTNAAVQALNAGRRLSDSFTVLSEDGTAQVVTVTISGSQRRGGDHRRRAPVRWSRPAAWPTARRARRRATGDLQCHRRGQPERRLRGGGGTATASQRLRQLHADGRRAVDLHAGQQQRGGAGAQCGRHAERQLHRDTRGRHRSSW